MSETYLHERKDGTKVEYRRAKAPAGILALECRELERAGYPRSAQGFPVSGPALLALQPQGTDIPDLLDPRIRGRETVNPTEAGLAYSSCDLVVDTLSGHLVGRVAYTLADGWAGVDDGTGRVDEYPAARLVRAR